MLLESHLDDKSIIVFDCESVGTVDKGGVAVRGHPDKVLSSMIVAIKSIARQVGEALNVDTLPAPTDMEVRFSLKVDSNAIVSIARNEADGQVVVVLKYGS